MHHITTQEMYQGIMMDIKTLVGAGVRTLHVDRPCMTRKGWEATSADKDGIGLTITSQPYHTRAECEAALRKAFGEDIPIVRGYWVG